MPSSSLIAAILAASCAIAVVVALFWPLIGGRSEARRRYEAIANRGAPTERGAASEESSRKRTIEAALRELEEKQKIRPGVKPSLINRIRQAGLSNWTRTTYWLICVGTGSFTALIALLMVGVSLIPSLGFGVAGGLLLPHWFVNFKRARRLKKFSDEFPNAVDVIVRGVKAGLPLADCLRIISFEAQEPVRSEFKAIIDDQVMGVPIDQAVQRLSERVPLTEANFFGIVIALQSKTGGSLAEALGNLSKVLRERKKMKAKIKAVSAEAKASAGIIGSLPVAVSCLIYITSPAYIALLFTTTTGHIVLAVSAFWMGIGIMVMRKMINFDF